MLVRHLRRPRSEAEKLAPHRNNFGFPHPAPQDHDTWKRTFRKARKILPPVSNVASAKHTQQRVLAGFVLDWWILPDRALAKRARLPSSITKKPGHSTPFWNFASDGVMTAPGTRHLNRNTINWSDGQLLWPGLRKRWFLPLVLDVGL